MLNVECWMLDVEIQTMPALYPLLFTPVYKDYLWGGDTIGRMYGRDVPPGIVAESWEVSAHPDGMSVVANGPLRPYFLPIVSPPHK